jgi:hypothetical protein
MKNIALISLLAVFLTIQPTANEYYWIMAGIAH